MRNNPITATIDFDQNGLQHGFLRLPYSRDDSAWGSIMIPVTQIKNGDGPTALLTGGNHGDEYEGPVALYDFIQRTAAHGDIERFQGRVIMIPAMNAPAFGAGSRVSPIDGGNLNRVFPGKPDGTPTEIIADYFSRVLLPLADYVLDIHSGGKTLDFLPFAACHVLDDKRLQARAEAAMAAFGAPYQLRLLEIDAEGMYDTQAERMGKVFVSTELGGGGTTTPDSVAIARRGVENFLIHCGVLQGELTPHPTGSVMLDMPDASSYLFSERAGLLEPCVTLGDVVNKGQLMARIHVTERTALPPHEIFAPRSGLIIARHLPSLVQMGDTLYVIADRI